MKMNGTLRALITGGGSGIGEAIALRLAADGGRVLIVGRDAVKLAAVAARAPRQIEFMVADLRIEAQRRDLASRARVWGDTGINVLVNNAGVSAPGFFDELPGQHIAELLETNLLAPIQLTHELLPDLKRQPTAHVVNIGSVFGFIGYPAHAVYSAGKFGLRGFSEALRRELTGSSVRVHHVAPRATLTSLNSVAVNQLNEALGNRVDEPSRVASIVARTIADGAAEVVIGWPERFFARLNALVPTLIDGALIKQVPLIRRFISAEVRS